MKKRTYAARTTHLVRLWQFGQLVNHTSFVRNNSVTIFLTCAPPEKCNETQRAIVSAPAEWLEVCESQPLLRLLIFISVIFSIRFVSSILLLIHVVHENENNCGGIGVMFGSLRIKESFHVLQNLANKWMRIDDVGCGWWRWLLFGSAQTDVEHSGAHKSIGY